MSQVDIIRAWKDENYRNSLSPAERAALPASPAGAEELNATALSSIVGGSRQVGDALAIQPQSQAKQTLTVGSEQCCSTGDLACGGGGGFRLSNVLISSYSVGGGG